MGTGRDISLVGATINGDVMVMRQRLGALDMSDAVVQSALTVLECEFTGPVRLSGATFKAPVQFAGARFTDGIEAHSTAFLNAADFRDSTFAPSSALLRDASFREASFGGPTIFRKVTFEGTVSFAQAKFLHDRAEFESATFKSGVVLTQMTANYWTARDSTFHGDVDGDRIFVTGGLQLTGATFHQAVWLDSSVVLGHLSVDKAQFHKGGSVGDLLVYGGLSLESCLIGGPFTLRVETAHLSMRGARFNEGARIAVRFSTFEQEPPAVICGAIKAEGRVHIEGIPRLDSQCEELRHTLIPFADDALPLGTTLPHVEPNIPQVIDLKGTDLALLTFSRLDLSVCRFQGSHAIDQLRIEASTSAFPRSPKTLRWTARRIIAEERLWRQTRRLSTAWQRPECGHSSRGTAYLHGEVPPGPAEIAEFYRALRKGREDLKDEPGAADFYYGEMEMRRHARRVDKTARLGSGRAGERVLLWLYWVLSGYGLRAGRALCALLTVVLLFAVAFHTIGFTDPSDPLNASATQAGGQPQGIVSWQALAYSLGTASAVVDAPTGSLSTVGIYLRIALRVIGPVLIGLVLLAIRGRVKR